MKLILWAAIAFALIGCQSRPKTYLWKIEKEGRQGVIFGSLHEGIPAKSLPPRVLEHHSASDALIAENIEIDAEKVVDMEVSPTKLDELLSKEAWAQLTSRLKGQSPEELRKLSPANAIYTYAQALARDGDKLFQCPRGKLENSKSRMDQELIDLAKANGKVLGQLESTLWASKECANVEYAYLLQVTLEEEASRTCKRPDLIEAYWNGDEKILGQQKGSRKTNDCFFKLRHETWVPLIESYVKAYDRPFIMVGVGHMFNQTDSLLARLKERGFQIERID